VPIKIRDLIRMIERDGWQLVRTTGSHRHYRHPTKPGTVTIPGHPSDEPAIGTERSILKQAGLERSKR
jgi:predicted RNA binding protein YcfA (HicA-like mRNA interferase family)